MSFFFHLVLASFQSREIQKSFKATARCGWVSVNRHILWFWGTSGRKFQSVEISSRPRGCQLTSFPHEPLPASGIVHLIGRRISLHRQCVSGIFPKFPTARRAFLLRCDHGERLAGLGDSYRCLAGDLSSECDHHRKSAFSRAIGIHHHCSGFWSGFLLWEIAGTKTHRDHSRWCRSCGLDFPSHHQSCRMDRQPDLCKNL